MWDRKIIKTWAKQDLANGRYKKALLITWLTTAPVTISLPAMTEERKFFIASILPMFPMNTKKNTKVISRL